MARYALNFLFLFLSGCAAIELTKGSNASSHHSATVSGEKVQLQSLRLHEKDSAVDLNSLCKNGRTWNTVLVKEDFFRSLFSFFSYDAKDVRYSCKSM